VSKKVKEPMRAGKSGRKARAEAANRKNQQENFTARQLDHLADFEEFQATLLPAIRRDLKAGLSAKDIRKKYQAMVQARLVMTALLDPDAGKSTAAAKDIMDREEGRATENVKHTHRMEDLPDAEVDALLFSELGIKPSSKDEPSH
jgi:hypothetical protein